MIHALKGAAAAAAVDVSIAAQRHVIGIEQVQNLRAFIASPFKFCDQVLRGIGGTADAFGPALIRRLSCETQIDAPAPLTGLDARPVRFGGCVDKAQMLHTVDEFLK